MKNVRKSLPEPQELVDYRARFARAPKQPGWREFTADPRRREPVKNQLRADQRTLCCYCENRLIAEDESIEHFVPRSADHSRELEWSNLLLCCSGGEKPLSEHLADASTRYDPAGPKTCGHSKLRDPGPILNPLDLPPVPCLFRYSSETGAIQADLDSCRSAGVDATAAEATIALLGLRAGRLNRARLTIIDELLRQVDAASVAPAFSPARAQEVAAELLPPIGPLPAFFTTIRWVLGLGAENHLRTIGYQG